MNIHIIKTEQEYKSTLRKIDELLEATENSEQSEQLEILSILVEDYESKHYKIEMPEPIEAINFRLEQLGLSRKDLEKTIGSRGRVSEILNRKRNLTLAMIRNLHEYLNIPADILIHETNVNKR
jgi:HTH-type transcriptional regulator/antitoxin HigA